MQKKPWGSTLRFLFNRQEEHARGRCVMMASGVLSGLIGIMTGGVFYTTFLMQNGINVVNIGIITFVPYIANCFSIFAPSILERFERRRYILAASRLAFYALNILGVTLIPMLVKDQHTKIALFVVVVFAAHVINALFSSGYTAWHLHFIPPSVRANFYPAYSTVVSFSNQLMGVCFALLADLFAASSSGPALIAGMRFAAFVLALVDIWVLLSPKEYPYEKTADRPRLRDIFVKPLTHRNFVLMMLILFVYNICIYLPQGVLNYYLLNDVGVQYTMIEGVNMLYPLIMIVFMRYWKRALNRFGWVETFTFSILMNIIPLLAYSCVTSANYLWLFPTVRIVQHFVMMGSNVATTNMPYLYMPQEDQTNYISFSTLCTSGAIFLGMFGGTMFIKYFPALSVRVGELMFCNMQVLMWCQAALYVGLASLALFCLKQFRKNV